MDDDEGPGARALALTEYFTEEHEFEPERYHRGIILYKRTNPQNIVERVVVKHMVENEYVDRDEEIADEEAILRRLWGAEHVIRLLSIVHDRAHRSWSWKPPFSRPAHALSRILPWKLRIDQIEHPDVTQFNWFVMEYLPRGDGDGLLARCRAQNIDEISEPLLWYFFLCLIRGCIAMAWPPNVRNAHAPPVVRETPGRRRNIEGWCHWDLHLGNIMFGGYNVDDDVEPVCHQGVPVLKIIDFGLSSEIVPNDARQKNILDVGDVIYQLATPDIPYPIYNEEADRPTFDVDDIDNMDEFPTYLDEDFYRSERYSRDLRQLLARCLAVDPPTRPSLGGALRFCERKVAQTPNWRVLADEVSELFDAVPGDDDDDDDDDDPDYVPSDTDDDDD